MKDLVVSVYQEDISWIKNIKSIDRIFIYNKGNRVMEVDEKTLWTNLPNFGREAHSFIYHIVNNYDKLAEYTIFLQGNPFYHSTLTPDNIETKFSEKIYKEEREPAFVDGNTLQEKLMHDWTGLTKGIYSRYLEGEEPEIYFSAGAQWIVHRDSIRSKSLRLYQDLLNELNTHRVTNTDGIVNPWNMEGFWNYLFDKNTIEKQVFVDNLTHLYNYIYKCQTNSF